MVYRRAQSRCRVMLERWQPCRRRKTEVAFESALSGEDVAMADVAAETVVASVATTGTAVTFRIPGATTVPSDGAAHKSSIGRFDFKPTIDYLAVPRHTDSVFRRVKMVNESASPLLADRSICLSATSLLAAIALIMQRNRPRSNSCSVLKSAS